ncbi:DUF4091 domain-containing protein [Paenibacillus sp. GD4]|uniref:DUF4091 domain-containing protein n=1 Tax=Paenibacillus sp. GD4 TaxID=3068890 RepID=UPI0027966FC7|nr:DUF4091 domain-containing protein [Paenibacillus sp. GD4]MDQ1914023.1 DUF4091 domain-containing protein [Paenibacillus sp. GD4]
MNSNHGIHLETRLISALAKVFADGELSSPVFSKASALRNETFSFQVAYRAAERIRNMRVSVESDLQEAVTLHRVGLAPSEYPVRDHHDGYVLRSTPGLYPDPLYPLSWQEEVPALGGQWHAIWVTVRLTEQSAAGLHPIRTVFKSSEGEVLSEETFHLEVLPPLLPKQTLFHTEWFHADCIAEYYRVGIFSEKHWELIGEFIETAVKNGVNLLLTPLFTPPLDTQVGGERPTVQLVDVTLTEDGYAFGFNRLKRWVELGRSKGIEYFEFSHLFTQWGAKHAPKIIGWQEGEARRLFGWETDASGPEYKGFLARFLPELVSFIKQNGLEKLVFFHVSDEPHLPHLEAYASAAGILDEHLKGFPRIDALSDIAFYEKGVVPTPVPALDRIEPFVERNVTGLWTYYCNSQFVDVSNRFFAHASARNRIIGYQLYKYDIKGFLHWGFNFWYSQYSKKLIDPFRVTDCGLAFPSGDAFVVYPGPEGPIESLRLVVFHDALQDIRALQLLERYIGREQVLALIEEELDTPLTFKVYPREDEWLLATREKVNRRILSYESELSNP